MRCRTYARFRGCGHGVKRVQTIGAQDYQHPGAADLSHRNCVSVHLEILERTAAFCAAFLGGFPQRFRGTVAERDYGRCKACVVAGPGDFPFNVLVISQSPARIRSSARSETAEGSSSALSAGKVAVLIPII
jgi:hypothetical protein